MLLIDVLKTGCTCTNRAEKGGCVTRYIGTKKVVAKLYTSQLRRRPALNFKCFGTPLTYLLT